MELQNDWKGLKLEVDETNFDFGTLYEIECESSDPKRAKRLLKEFLKENEINYSLPEREKERKTRIRKEIKGLCCPADKIREKNNEKNITIQRRFFY